MLDGKERRPEEMDTAVAVLSFGQCTASEMVYAAKE